MSRVNTNHNAKSNVNIKTNHKLANMNIPYHAQRIRLDRSILDKQGHNDLPLFLNVVMHENEHGVAVMNARVFFPPGYKSGLVNAIQTNRNDSGNMSKAATMVELDMSLIRSKNKGKPYQLWLGRFYVLPAMPSYRNHAQPHELSVTKGIGRIVLCHAINVWIKHGPRLWPDLFPSVDDLVIALRAESNQGHVEPVSYMLRRALYGMGLHTPASGHTKLIDYYKSMGFHVKTHTLTGTTPMKGKALDIVKNICRNA